MMVEAKKENKATPHVKKKKFMIINGYHDIVFGIDTREQKLGMVIRVNGSYSCRVNIRIVSTFVNPNPTRIINMSIFANPNPAYLLFVLGRSTRI